MTRVLALPRATDPPSPGGAPALDRPQIIPDLAVGTPAGWSAPIVPRNTPGATTNSAVLPETLYSATPTYLNWAVHQNVAVYGTWHDDLELDDELVQRVTRSNTEWLERWWLALDTGPMLVPGGRHTLTVYSDPDYSVDQDYDFRGNNTWSGQWIWDPIALTADQGYGVPAPAGSVADPVHTDCTGFRFVRPPGAAWVVGLAPKDSAYGYDLLVYDDYAGSTSGLSHELAHSALASNAADFIVGQRSGTPDTLYPAVVRTGPSNYYTCALSASSAAGRQVASGVGTWPSVHLGPSQIAHVYEVWCEAARREVATLTRFMGGSDLAMSVFPPGAGAVFGRAQAIAVSTPREGDNYDDLKFFPAVSGWYLLVVHRATGDFADDAMGYSLDLALGSVAVEEGAELAAPLAAWPTPATGPVRLDFALANPGPVRLDVFDASGRRVRALVHEPMGAGRHSLAWDGRGERGARAGAGLYWAYLEAPGRRETVRLVVLD